MNFKSIMNIFTSVTFYEFLISIIAIVIGIYSTNYSIKHGDLERCIADIVDAKLVNDSKIFFNIVLKTSSNLTCKYPDICYMEEQVNTMHKHMYFYMKDVDINYKFIKSNFYSKFPLHKLRGKIMDDLNKVDALTQVLVVVKSKLRDKPQSKKNNDKYIRGLLRKELNNDKVEGNPYGVKDMKKSIYKLNDDLVNYEKEFEYIHSRTMVGRLSYIFNNMSFRMIYIILMLIAIICVILYYVFIMKII